MPDNLIQKKNESTWYVVFEIPKDVRTALGNRSTLTKSLKTGIRSEAMDRRLPYLAQWKADVAAARQQKITAREEWRPALADRGVMLEQSIYARFLDAMRNPTDSSDGTIPEFDSRIYKKELYQLGLESDAEHLGKHGKAALFKLITNTFQTKPNTQIDALNRTASLTRDIMVLLAEYKHKLSTDEIAQARELIQNPTSYKPRSPISPGMIEAWSKHLVKQIESAKTRDSHKARVEKISKFLTAEGAQLTFDTIHKFLVQQGGARQTLLNYLWSGRDFWKWAIKYNTQFREQFSREQCPFDGHDLPRTGKEAGEHWIPFTRTEVEDLYKQARESIKDELANLIIFGAYTGARIEEIGRIEPGDTLFDKNGEPIGFNIPKSKSVAGVRDVPLHTSLIPLYKQLSTEALSNDGYLFKGGKNKYGVRLDRLSKQFGRMKKNAGFSHLHVFHSIRKTTTTELHQAGVGLEVLPYIVGHENKSFTLSVYSSGCSFEQKQKAIQRLHFSFEK